MFTISHGTVLISLIYKKVNIYSFSIGTHIIQFSLCVHTLNNNISLNFIYHMWLITAATSVMLYSVCTQETLCMHNY